MKNIYVPYPSVQTQKKIADYLDDKCGKIDQAIEGQKKIIEKLKEYKQSVITEAVTKGLDPNVPMKDSGIEWIGQIPKHWKIVKLKTKFSFGKGLNITKENLTETGIPVISYGQIHSKTNNGIEINDSLIRYVSETYLEENPNSLVNRGDFIIADTSEDLEGVGNSIHIDRQMNLFAGYHSLILKRKKEDFTFSKYLAYLMQSDCWRSQLRCQVMGIKLFSITQKILKETSIIIPSLIEQNQIVTYLDAKCREIESLIEKKQKNIEELEQYKKSLIYEYVTGKKEVI
jgi:type I restriction enzyme S subunit